MTSFSGLGIGLGVIFGCLLLAIAAELYYLLCWKKKIIIKTQQEGNYSNHAEDIVHVFCGQKRLHKSSKKSENSQDNARVGPENANCHEADPELGSNKDLLVKTYGEESVESELMRLHNLAGPPRFLFTIKEETKEDLESDDGKSRCGDRSRKGSRMTSFSEFIDTPFLSPLASPPLKSPPSLDSYSHRGFNPLFESSAEVDQIYKLRSSPPPKFKFLRDAEEKLYKRLMQEAEINRASMTLVSEQEIGVKNPPSSIEEKDGSMFTFIVGGAKKDAEIYHQPPQYPSSSSQILPLASSPTRFKPLDKKLTVH